MANAIKFEDIRPGDKIRVIDVSDLTVTRIDAVALKSKEGLMRYKESGMHSLIKRTFELIERPVALPTEPGSVIRAESRRGDVGTWMLKSNGVWVSHNGTNLTSPDLRAVIAQGNIEFEVLG